MRKKFISIPFTMDPKEYSKHVLEYCYRNQDEEKVIKYINKFINSCLVLGNFLYKVDKLGSEIKTFRYLCSTHIFLKQADKSYIELFIRGRLSGYISVGAYERGTKKDKVDRVSLCIMEVSVPFSKEFINKTNLKLFPGDYLYRFRTKAFKDPPIDDLPLYINVPFVCEYVKAKFNQ